MKTLRLIAALMDYPRTELWSHRDELLEAAAQAEVPDQRRGQLAGFVASLLAQDPIEAQERWLEVSSVSNFETFQTNRMKIRFKDSNGKTQLLHSLNGSSLALPRIMACLLENNQFADGVRIPAALQPYFGTHVLN